MKIAITGKGGVGKTTLSAGLSLLFAREGKKVIAIDCDPDTNLAATLGFPQPEKIVPINEMKELIKERVGEEGIYFRLNPKVDDIPEKYCPEYQGIRLMVMGVMKKGGSGCFCPENAFVKALLSHLLIGRQEVVILDMVAGIEHLGRGTASAVDALVVVVEPSLRSLETAERIKKLGEDLKIKRLFMVGNKIQSNDDEELIKKNTFGLDLIGSIWYDRKSVDKIDEKFLESIRPIKEKISKTEITE